MIKSVAGLVIGVNLFIVGFLGFLIFYPTGGMIGETGEMLYPTVDFLNQTIETLSDAFLNLPDYAMETWFGTGPDGLFDTADDVWVPSRWTKEMEEFLEPLEEEANATAEEMNDMLLDLKASAQELQTAGEQMSYLSYGLLAMAIIGILLIVYGVYKGFRIEKEPA